jgi:hypothetical protein
METLLDDRKIKIQRSQTETSKKRLSVDDMEYWQSMAKKLDSSVLANDITMQEIVDEVNAVRKERYEKQNRI